MIYTVNNMTQKASVSVPHKSGTKYRGYPRKYVWSDYSNTPPNLISEAIKYTILLILTLII